MTDDDRLLLASRYLDDDLDPAGRTVVEGDPELLALVDDLRAVDELVAAVPPAEPARRDDAVEAALAVWDDMTSPTTAAAPPAPVGAADVIAPPPVPLRPRARRMTVWLGAAAAAAAVFALAGVVITTSRDDDTSDAVFDGASSADESVERAADDGGLTATADAGAAADLDDAAEEAEDLPAAAAEEAPAEQEAAAAEEELPLPEAADEVGEDAAAEQEAAAEEELELEGRDALEDAILESALETPVVDTDVTEPRVLVEVAAALTVWTALEPAATPPQTINGIVVRDGLLDAIAEGVLALQPPLEPPIETSDELLRAPCFAAGDPLLLGEPELVGLTFTTIHQPAGSGIRGEPAFVLLDRERSILATVDDCQVLLAATPGADG